MLNSAKRGRPDAMKLLFSKELNRYLPGAIALHGLRGRPHWEAHMRTDLTGLKFVIAGANIASTDIQHGLERRNASVRIACDCAAAFEAVDQDRPHFAIIDWGHADCDAVISELTALDIPYIYVGGPSARDRDTVRATVSANLAEVMLWMTNEAEELRA